MSALRRIEKLLLAMITGISQGTLLPLYIPKPSALDVIEHDTYDAEEHLDNFRRRELNSNESALKYAQIIAICSVCAEVLAGNA